MKLIYLMNIFLFLTALTVLSACSGGEPYLSGGGAESQTFGRGTPGQAGNASGGDTKEAEPEVEVIKVGTMGAYFPFSHTDEDGNLTGYDVEAARLIDEKIEDVEFEFVTGTFDSLFLELDAGRTQMVANQIAKNPEREEKYLFSDEGYILAQTKLVVNSEDNTRTTLEDMEGGKMGGVTGDYFTIMMENYNAASKNPFNLQYYDGEYTGLFTDISTGRIMGTINDMTVVNGFAQSMGLNIKCVGDVLESSYSYFCIRSDAAGQELKTKIDAALEEALTDGSLTALSMDWFGADFTKSK